MRRWWVGCVSRYVVAGGLNGQRLQRLAMVNATTGKMDGRRTLLISIHITPTGRSMGISMPPASWHAGFETGSVFGKRGWCLKPWKRHATVLVPPMPRVGGGMTPCILVR